MRAALAALTATALLVCAPALAQQLRKPSSAPPPIGPTLRQVAPAPRLPTALGTRTTDEIARERCLQQATRTIQPTGNARVAVAQRRLAAVETQRAARGGDAADPTDRSGLRAQRDIQQRAATRERNAARQRLAVAHSNCR